MSMDNQTIDTRQFSSPFFFFRSLSITFLAGWLIAIFLYTISIEKSFYSAVLFSQIMGFSICTCIHLALYLVRPSRYLFLYPTVAAGLVCGIMVAFSLFSVFCNIPLDSSSILRRIFLALCFGTIISLFFIINRKLTAITTRLQEEQIRALENEKNMLQARFKLLQAQIEPHFLFNTLANIEGLLTRDVKTAGTMLNNLTHYLRASLKKSRKTRIPLKEELEMVRAYLEIFRVRMRERLRYRLECDEKLNDVYVPPMLIQPLVENSILHGLEPKPEGGEIIVSVRWSKEGLRIEVADTGQGLGQTEKQGLGLSNVRERLILYYGEKATLHIEENQPGGVRIIMEAPCELPPS